MVRIRLTSSPDGDSLSATMQRLEADIKADMGGAMKEKRAGKKIRVGDVFSLNCGATIKVEKFFVFDNDVNIPVISVEASDRDGGIDDGTVISMRRDAIPSLIKLLGRIYRAKWDSPDGD